MNRDKKKHYFFVGIAGTGMSAIAQYLRGTGMEVSGSDRLFNQEQKMLIQGQFEQQGIRCFNQDGSGITRNVDVVVVSTAIEESNIEYAKAKEMEIPVMKRSELLASLSSNKKTIAVGGTSGKSTTTAMIFHILQENGYSPSLITGAGLTSLQQEGLPGNTWVGNSDWLVIEADESDGSIVNYCPEIGVVLNIDRDHKEFDELMQLFSTFRAHTRGKFIINHDHALLKTLSQSAEYDFGTSDGTGYIAGGFRQTGFQITFDINGEPFRIPVIGKFNMENALAATAVAGATGISTRDCSKALEKYSGIYRRMQLVGINNGIYVIDDFAHNPAEVASAIEACRQISSRITAWFQPHGYGPLRFMHEELAKRVSDILRDSDTFIMSDVYYAGGTVNKDIGPEVVIEEIVKHHKNARLIAERDKFVAGVKANLRPGDVILLMGARDPSLSDFALDVLAAL